MHTPVLCHALRLKLQDDALELIAFSTLSAQRGTTFLPATVNADNSLAAMLTIRRSFALSSGIIDYPD